MSVPSLTNICKHTRGNTFRNVRNDTPGSFSGDVGEPWAGKSKSVAYPSSLQQVPLALHAVLYVDQTQQILLERDNKTAEMERD